MSLTIGYKTDVGRARKMNQDSVRVVGAAELDSQLDALLIVADGMGGQQGGEIASGIVVETLPDAAREYIAARGELNEGDVPKLLRQALAAANGAVWQYARERPELRGMGTTCVAAAVQGGMLTLGNIGDSRAYLLRDGELLQLTEDHSLVAEHVRAGDLTRAQAEQSRFKNIITRAIGISKEAEADVNIHMLEPGDVVLLCSDGLTNMADEHVIARVLASVADPQKACEKLVRLANKNGGADNITAIVAHYGPFTPIELAEPLEDDTEDDAPPAARTFDPENDFDARSFPAESPRASGGVAVPLLVALVLVLGGLSGYLVWDKINAAKPPKPSAPAASPLPDLENAPYAPVKMLADAAVRGAPLLIGPGDAVYAVGKDGRMLRIVNGKAAPVPNLLSAPTAESAEHFAVDAQGNLYRADHKAKVIEKYNASGTRKGFIGKNELQAPEAVAVDSRGNIYVSDKNRIKVFRIRTAPLR